jgi:hypothetical protein
MIASIDARCEGRRIELGLFTESGDCVDVLRVTRAEATALRDALNAALAEQERAYRPRQAPLLTVAAVALIGVPWLHGCASLAPDEVRLETVHVSHTLQHLDGTSAAVHHQYQAIGAAAHWERGGAYVDVGEYYSPGQGLDNRHEVFEARVGYAFKVHP